MKFHYPAPTALMGATTLILLLSGFRGISQDHITTSHLIYPSLGAPTETPAGASLPLPPPPEAPKPATSRDGWQCLLSFAPGNGGEREVWHTQPDFVWAEKFLEPGIHSRVDRVVVVLADRQTVVWNQRVTPSQGSIAPAGSTDTAPSPWQLSRVINPGPALQPGQTYTWY